MRPNILNFLTRRGDAREDMPAVAAPSAVPEDAVDQSQARMAAIRESIDLIEIDLAAMIRDVQRASDAVRGGTRATADLLGAISGQSEHSPPWRIGRPKARRTLRSRRKSSPNHPTRSAARCAKPAR